MGMFDEVYIQCPDCGELNYEQSKGGPCQLYSYVWPNECEEPENVKNFHRPTPDSVIKWIASLKDYIICDCGCLFIINDSLEVERFGSEHNVDTQDKGYLVKPCPFCGLQMEDSDADDYLHPTREGVWSINCLEIAGGCGVQMFGDTKDEVIDKWNRRA